MGLRFQIIERADPPAFAHQKIDYVRTDQARATSN
jgi:hypothetical protein